MIDNNKVLDAYFSNINEAGKRMRTWLVVAERTGIPAAMLSRVSSIRKHSTDEAFELFVQCTRDGRTVLLSNGTSSGNIEHITNLLRKGNTITGAGKSPTTIGSNKSNNCAYLIHSAGYYKLGVIPATSLKYCVSQIQAATPHLVELVAKTITPDAHALKTQLHDKVKKNTVRGEWFTLSPEEKTYITDKLEAA